MGPKLGNGSNNNTNETPSESQLRKRRKRNKKPKDAQQDGASIAAAATKDKALAVTRKDPPKVPCQAIASCVGSPIIHRKHASIWGTFSVTTIKIQKAI